MLLFDEPISVAAPEPVLVGSLEDRLPPRDYQRDAAAEFFRAYDAGERHMLYRLATGTGKTYCAALTAEEWLRRDSMNRVLVLAYERNLVEQFRDELIEFLPECSVGLEMSSDGAVGRVVPDITVASRQTLYVAKDDTSRLFKFDALRYNWLIVCDEAHGYKYGLKSVRHIVDWFEQNPESAWLGMTATPERGDGVSLARMFGHNCCEMKLSEAIHQGYLVPMRQKFIQVEGIDFKNLREVAGDFDDGELDKILSQREQLLAMADPLLDIAGTKRTLVFTPGVECARQLAGTITAEIKERGLPHGYAEYMVGETPKDERRRIITGHQRGDFQILVVCGLCRAGYNDPGLEAVAVFRPTKSRVMAEQMKGRGVRPLRGIINGLDTPEDRKAAIAASDKPHCLIIDMVGVSGMAEVASTAHLLATGEEDVVIDRANELLADDENEDDTIEDAIGKAKAEIEAEREAARILAEERKRKEREEFERQAKLRAEVHYHSRDVGGVHEGGSHKQTGRVGDGPTEKQFWYLVKACGFTKDAAKQLSKRQASAIIGKHKNKSGEAAPQGIDWSGPPTVNQRKVLERHGKPVPGTAREAGEVIKNITWSGKASV